MAPFELPSRLSTSYFIISLSFSLCACSACTTTSSHRRPYPPCPFNIDMEVSPLESCLLWLPILKRSERRCEDPHSCLPIHERIRETRQVFDLGTGTKLRHPIVFEQSVEVTATRIRSMFTGVVARVSEPQIVA